jgi:uncharacterized protein with beta-barrel porin domain
VRSPNLAYYWDIDQSRILPKAALEYVRASTGSFRELGSLDPLTATGASVERSRILLGAEIGHYWIFSFGAENITFRASAKAAMAADAGASASLSLSNTARLYINYDGKFRSAMQSHQGTVGAELKW